MRSSKCNHVYSKEAILAAIRMSGNHGEIECPVVHCAHYVRQNVLVPDRKMAQLVEREKRRLEEEAAHEDQEYMRL